MFKSTSVHGKLHSNGKLECFSAYSTVHFNISWILMFRAYFSIRYCGMCLKRKIFCVYLDDPGRSRIFHFGVIMGRYFGDLKELLGVFRTINLNLLSSVVGDIATNFQHFDVVMSFNTTMSRISTW